MLPKASAIRCEVRTDPRAEVEERAGSAGGLVRTLTIVGLACLGLRAPAQAQSFINAWGANSGSVPPLPSGVTYVEIAAGAAHTVARLSDGSVLEWGSNYSGYWNVPVPPLPSGLTYVEIATGGSLGYDYYSGFVMTHYTVARRSDGSVVAWGTNQFGGFNNVPQLTGGLTYVEIAAGPDYTVARRSDGSVVVGTVVTAPPSGLTFVEVAAGGNNVVARLSDGSVVAWGDNQFGQCNVPALPARLTYAEVAAGGMFDTYTLTSYGGFTVARYGLAATVVSVGTGCGGAGIPAFSCNAPRIGQNVTFSLTQGTPNGSGFLYYSGVPAAPIVLGSGCAVELDLATLSTLLPVVANATGAWSVTSGPVDPSVVVGLQVALQIALFNTPGPLGIDLSNALIATVGY